MRMSNLIIGLMIITLAGTTIVMFLASASIKYNTSFNETNIAFFESLNTTNELIQELDNKTASDTQATGLTDIVGSFLSDGVGALKIAKSSVVTYDSMINEGGKHLGLPTIFGVILVAILTVSILFIIISAGLKKDM